MAARKKAATKKPVELKLKAPSSLAVCYQVLELRSGSPMVCAAAALGVCWRGPKPPRVRFKAGQAAEYGSDVLDHLTKRGMPIGELVDLGILALDLITGQLPDNDGIEEAVGNSEGQEDS